MKTNHLKYPFYLFLALLSAKGLYVVIESIFNYYVLITTTSIDVTEDTLRDLNVNGHRISSVGITLLLIPLFYLFVKNQTEKTIYTSLVITAIFTYTITYNMLNYAVDYIVETNKEKRYDAYYINIFKYGLLNSDFKYDSFIDSKKIKANNLDVDDRILLANSFLLLYADEKLIDKLQKKGKEKFAEGYMRKHKQDDYDKQFSAFEIATQELEISWMEFEKVRASIRLKQKKYNNEAKIKQAYNDFLASFKKSFKTYEKAWESVNAKIAKETTNAKLKSIRSDLRDYFRYPNHDSVKKKYKEKMYEEFGHQVEPRRWKNSNNKLTYASIKKVIVSEIHKEANKEINDVPQGLNPKEFSENTNVQCLVADKLKAQGIEVSTKFDYKYPLFKRFYTTAMAKKSNKIPLEFKKEFEKRIGKNDLTLGMNWIDYVNSNYVQEQIKSKLPTTNEKDFKALLKVIESKDLGNFEKLVYLPKVIEEIDNARHKREDFLDGEKAEKVGDEAVKFLYIPPFALAVSIIALLLNLVTFVGMLLHYYKVSSFGVNSAKVMLLIFIVFLPTITQHNAFNSPLIQKVSNPDLQTYLSFLNWISYYEGINSKWH